MQGENSLGRLNEMLFAELERLDALDVADQATLNAEVARSKAIQRMANEINASAKTVLDTARLRAEWSGAKFGKTPRLLEG